MAQDSELKHMPAQATVQAYHRESAVRADIRDADVLLFRGAGLESRIISVGTGSPYSHAAVAFRSSSIAPYQTDFGVDRVCFIEAVGKGIHMGLLSTEISTYHGAVELWRVTDRYAPKLAPSKVIAEARRYIGRPYAFNHLYGFIFDWLTLGWLNLRSHSHDKRSFFCSQLVSRAYVKGGVDLNVHYGDAATAPGDLVAGGRIQFVHAFASSEHLGDSSFPPAPNATPKAVGSEANIA